jgi:hypothetical protein
VAKPLIERLARINDPSLWSLIDTGRADHDAHLNAMRQVSLHKAALCVRETMGDIEKNAEELTRWCLEAVPEPLQEPVRNVVGGALTLVASRFLYEVERMRR